MPGQECLLLEHGGKVLKLNLGKEVQESLPERGEGFWVTKNSQVVEDVVGEKFLAED